VSCSHARSRTAWRCRPRWEQARSGARGLAAACARLEVVPPLAGATIGRGLRQLFDTDGGHVSLTGFVAGMLDDDPERYDAPTVVEAYRARINGVLPAGLVLVGDDLYAQDDTEWDAYELRMPVNDLDLFAIVDASLPPLRPRRHHQPHAH
jgi:hypothetical protein